MMSGFAGDLRAAFRRLIAAPLFTIFAVLSLAVGVGVTTAAYSIVENLFFQELRIPEPDRLAYVTTPGGGRMLTGSISEPDFLDLRDTARAFSSLSATSWFAPSVTTRTTTAILRGEAVDGAYFSTLGVGAARGRMIQPADDANRLNVVVLSHALWRARFLNDPNIVGESIRVSGRPFEVIGIAPDGFFGARHDISLSGSDLWMPRSAAATLAPEPASVLPPRDRRRLAVFGRLAANSSMAAATAELKQIGKNLDAAFPPPGFDRPGAASERQWSARAASDVDETGGSMRRFGMTLVGLVALVLMVACTNLANLVLARGTERQQEITVRFALGASRWRLVRAQMAESLLLAIAGAAGAAAVFRSLQLLMTTEFNMGFSRVGQLSLTIDPQPNANALLIAVGALLLSLLVFGLEPALQLTRNADIRGELAIGGNPRARRQRILLRWQVLTATGFFIVSTLLVKYMVREMRHDPGIDIDQIGVATVNFEIQEWNEARARRTLDRVLEIARRQPGVEAVAASTSLPFGVSYPGRSTFYAPGQPSSGWNGQRGMMIATTPAIFEALGVRITRGRGFDDRDTATGPRVAVISEFSARQIFGSADTAVGREFVIDEPKHERILAMVVGVASDTDVMMMLGDPRALVYVPLTQRYESFAAITVRASGRTSQAITGLREALHAADPDLAVNVIGPGRSVLAGPFQLLRGFGYTTIGLGMLTLLLAMIGLFGIQTHIVARRTREIGVRMSFGATQKQIRWMVISQGARPVIDGMLLGLVAGLIGRVFIRNYLEISNMEVIDVWALVLIPIPLSLASYCACYLPASRAAAVDPNVALRHL